MGRGRQALFAPGCLDLAGEAGTRAAVPLSGTQAPGANTAAGPPHHEAATTTTHKNKKTEIPAGTARGKAAEVEASVQDLLVTCGDTLRRRFGSAERAFAFFDTDADGAVSFAELVSGLGGLGVTMQAREARRVVQACAAASARAGDVCADVLSRATFAKVFRLEGVRPEAARAVRLVLDALYEARASMREVFDAALARQGARAGRVRAGVLVAALRDVLVAAATDAGEAVRQFEVLCASKVGGAAGEALSAYAAG